MAAAIWSCPTGQMLATPLATFVRFCQNHGLLQVFDRPLWRTVKGGGGKSPDLAVAGGKAVGALDEALDQARAAAGLA